MTATPAFAAANSKAPVLGQDSVEPFQVGLGAPAQPPLVVFAVFQNGARANGGVESITQIIEGLPETRRLLITNSETPFTDRWRRAGADVVLWRLPYTPGTSWRTGGLVVLARRLINLVTTNWWTWLALRGRGAAAVHCNDPAPFWHVAVGARLAGVPLVLNLRDTKCREEGLDVPKYRRRFRWCARVLVLSREMKTFYERACFVRRGKKLPPIDYIYSVVDLERMRPLAPLARLVARRELGIPDETFAVGFIATFNTKKNQLGYLHWAAARLREICPTARTYFVGDFDPKSDAYAQSCAESARAQQLEEFVRFVGFCRQVEKWYQVCDLIVVPTRKEGLARCMIEALACGTPVVSFDVSSAREIIEENQCGRVVAQGDYEQLCQAIVELAQSPEIRRKYATNGIVTTRSLFSPETVLAKYRNFILGLRDKGSARGDARPPDLAPASQV